MSIQIDANRFRLDKATSDSGGQANAPAPRVSGRFSRVPIDLFWIQKAARLGAKALNVSLVLWYFKGLKKTNTVKLNYEVLEEFGVKPDAGRKALNRLEEAGLVATERHPGRKTIVTILECPQ